MKAKVNLVAVINDKEKRKGKKLSKKRMSHARGGQVNEKDACLMWCGVSNDSLGELIYFLPGFHGST